MILVSALLTAAISLLVWAIWVQVTNARKRAEVKAKSNYLKATKSPAEEATLLGQIAELRDEPELLAAKNAGNFAAQDLSSYSGRLHANDIMRTRDTLRAEFRRFEKNGIITTNFVLNPHWESTKDEKTEANGLIAEKKRLRDSGAGTADVDDELRRLADTGVVIEQHALGPKADTVGTKASHLARTISEVNNINTFVAAILKKALKDRPEKMAEVAERHNFTLTFQPITPQQSPLPSHLMTPKGVTSAVRAGTSQQGSGTSASGRKAPATKPPKPTTGQA